MRFRYNQTYANGSYSFKFLGVPSVVVKMAKHIVGMELKNLSFIVFFFRYLCCGGRTGKC